MSEQITTFCGINIKNENLEVITDNPNFNFEVDPSFEKVLLYDIEGNSVMVNSWIECAHYVNGGWVYEQQQAANLQAIALPIVILLSLYFIWKKISKK